MDQASPVLSVQNAANDRSKTMNQLVINYMYLRKTVGWVGTLLPIALIAGNVIMFTTTLPDSMSSYYYTHMRNLFVGALCALGVFLVAYAGYDEWDRWITNIAGLGAIGVAFCPTKPTVCSATQRTCVAPAVRTLSTSQNILGDIHLGFAAIAFIFLGVMALRFAKADSDDAMTGLGLWRKFLCILGFWPRPGEPPSAANKRRGLLCRISGFVILACVVLAVLSNLLPQSVKNDVPLLFIFEALAVFAFGISWFVKGQTLLPILQGD
jgi:hypothetical protein